MNRFSTSQPVRVKNEEHEHFGRAGFVIDQPASKPGYVRVQLDAVQPKDEDDPGKSQTADLFAIADLEELR